MLVRARGKKCAGSGCHCHFGVSGPDRCPRDPEYSSYLYGVEGFTTQSDQFDFRLLLQHR